ncbi:PGN_0703 family putative restriction endonuclease [Evansella tamaricis]|uniref:Uncharacterized protein n=1 Tax=Evansella tamaricis TaxID=2069301 RepID=A0ABS6JIK3_9BACI|nr:hypothetical protein [Evansella tamaricis]MBU9712687.1 hypothetical protein [Evansella tamaricis]
MVWQGEQFFDEKVLQQIDNKVNLHKEIDHVRSSAAACLNVLGSLGLSGNEKELLQFLRAVGVNATEIIPFPTGVNMEGEVYEDEGNVVFEWIGPKESPIHEGKGKRGQNRTSVDAYILTVIDGKVTQLLIEWKYTEKYNSGAVLRKFSGASGIERLRRYSDILAKLRMEKDLPFQLSDTGRLGVADLGYEPFYQLMRMTLLARMMKGNPLPLTESITVEDYKIIHLSHSKNDDHNILQEKHLRFSPGLQKYAGLPLHDVWKNVVLSDREKERFIGAYWDLAVESLSPGPLKSYLQERYSTFPL